MLVLYNILYTICLPFLFLRLLWRSRKNPAYRERWLERIGIFPSHPRPNGIWIHAVSVGETVAAIPFINELLRLYPSLQITITTTTPTGSARVRQVFGNKVFHVYMPYDLPWCLEGFINKVQPQLSIILETELWPNMLHSCESNKIPVLIANGRLSEISVRGYLKLKPLIRKMFESIHFIAAQSQVDYDNFVRLGISKEKIKISGNLKFDVDMIFDDQLKNQLGKRLVLVAASTHEGEEEMIIRVYQRLKKNLDKLALIIVPRHPDRFNNVASLLRKYKQPFVRRSSGKSLANKDVILGDSMGEMELYYSAADVAFVGGSMVPVGGHNLLEPAALGIPTVSGPYLFNFIEISQKLQQDNAVEIAQNEEQLYDLLSKWFANHELREQMSIRAKHVVEQNKGALQNLLEIYNSIVTSRAVATH